MSSPTHFAQPSCKTLYTNCLLRAQRPIHSWLFSTQVVNVKIASKLMSQGFTTSSNRLWGGVEVLRVNKQEEARLIVGQTTLIENWTQTTDLLIFPTFHPNHLAQLTVNETPITPRTAAKVTMLSYSQNCSYCSQDCSTLSGLAAPNKVDSMLQRTSANSQQLQRLFRTSPATRGQKNSLFSAQFSD
ncbi:hypothetical protein A4A49_23879 [Nicotiana attenuata]|uniref:Uncharacterized protein n=1 Tax=Nicotiana attenuata TaxID=49451 RepID=A0A1J6KFC6_NICAT|nr:hypothetical protein A4A49_23879 [Nicotiana attenuata]